jgi:hypothetical protein
MIGQGHLLAPTDGESSQWLPPSALCSRWIRRSWRYTRPAKKIVLVADDFLVQHSSRVDLDHQQDTVWQH